jgi:hypothetical protein
MTALKFWSTAALPSNPGGSDPYQDVEKVAPLAHLPDGLSAKGFREFGIGKTLSATLS